MFKLLLTADNVQSAKSSFILEYDVGQPRFRYPIKVYNVKLMDKSRPTDEITADSISGILPIHGKETN